MDVPRILVADDEPHILGLIQKAMSLEPWEIETASNGKEALELLSNGGFDVAILDLKMPYLNGIEVFKPAKKKGIQTDVLILTVQGSIENAVEAMKIGVNEFITKPFSVIDLRNTIRGLLESHHLPLEALSDRLDAFLSTHAFDSHLKADDLCRHFKISPRYVSKRFKEQIGVSFRSRLAYYRAERAKELLEFTDEPLYSIAERCGFRDYRQLTKTFRKVEEMSPKEYRILCRDSSV